MRRLALLFALVGCRTALGIPDETSVPGFAVRGTITGLTGVSAPTQFMLGTYVATPTADGELVFEGVANGTVATVTPSSPACIVTAGAEVAVADADVDGLVVTCDGLLAIGSIALSAPFDDTFAPSEPNPVLTGSVLTQQTTFDVALAYPEVAQIQAITFDNAAYTPGVMRALLDGEAHTVQVDVVSDQVGTLFAQPRPYTFQMQTTAPPKAFGHGKPSLVAEQAHFGRAVAASGDRLVVGMPDGASGGRAFVFRRSGRTWTEEAVLTGAGTARDGFGTSVAMTATRIVVGAPGAATGGTAYVFDLVGNQWTETKQLRPPAPASNDEFGAAVAVTASFIVVGAPSDACAPGGCVFEFPQPSGGVVTVKPARTGDRFGAAIAIDGAAIVIGAPGDDSSGPPGDDQYPEAGAAYVAQLGSIATLYIKADAPGADDQFGTAVAIDGDIVLVGAPLEDSNAAGDANDNTASGSGAAYVFQLDAGSWVQRRYVKAPEIHVGDNFGRSLAILANTVGTTTTRVVAIGAPFDNAGGTATDSGAVYAYRFDHATVMLTSSAVAKASNVGAGDQFGMAIALTPDSVLVGAPLEDSSGDAWNKPINEGALDAGAVYSVR
jgi:hypothetical protein